MTQAVFGFDTLSNPTLDYAKTTNRIKNTNNVIGIASIVSSIGLSPFFPNPLIGLGISATLLMIHLITKNHVQYRISRTAGVIFNQDQIERLKLTPKSDHCEVIPTEHPADTELWRKRLINAAKDNIVLSGNYCGGKAFISFLNLVKKRIEQRPKLKVVILSSPVLLKGEAKKSLERLLQLYPKNISLVNCPSLWHISPGIKKSTNHTKCMVIDYGRYFILGGSGVEDKFANTALDHLTKEEFLQKKGISIPTSPETPELGTSPSFLEHFLPDFRDQDWVFSSKQSSHSIGRQVYQQALLLANRWESYTQSPNQSQDLHSAFDDPKSLGLFSGNQTPIIKEDSITTQLLKTPAHSSSTSQIRKFETSAKKAEGVHCKVFAQGPEHSTNTFSDIVLKGIEKATKNLVIDHMYFHPTASIMNALIAAVKRGVRIKIITCGNGHGTSLSQKCFGPRNRYNYSYLMNALTPDERSRVSIFEFEGRKKGIHKKLIVIDDETVIAGSSNLGYKSLVTASDHELNFVAKSNKLAEETLSICKVDERHSKKIEREKNRSWSLSWSEYAIAAFHKTIAPLVG